MDALDLRTVHWVGISTGGMIGKVSDPASSRTHRLAHALQHGLQSTAVGNRRMGERAPSRRKSRWYGARLGDDGQALVHGRLHRRRECGLSCDPGRLRQNPGAGLSRRRRRDLRLALPDLPQIGATRIIAAGDDPVTPIIDPEEIRDAIPGAKLTVIDGQRHFSNVEVPDEFNPVLRDGLDDMLEEIER